MQLTKLLVLATTMAISAHGANLKGTTEQAVEIATADSLIQHAQESCYKQESKCLVLPGSMNGGKHPRGCPGAVWSSGSPAWSYCVNRSGRFPWWKDCCQWTGGSCKPKYTAEDYVLKADALLQQEQAVAAAKADALIQQEEAVAAAKAACPTPAQSQVKTVNGNANGAACHFPFQYCTDVNTPSTCKTYNECTAVDHADQTDGIPWCYTVASGKWGECNGCPRVPAEDYVLKADALIQQEEAVAAAKAACQSEPAQSQVIKTANGNANGAACSFPFEYCTDMGDSSTCKTYNECTALGHADGIPWCFVASGKWGECDWADRMTAQSHKTVNGNANGAACVFPFEYGGKTYNRCTSVDGDPRPWCSTEKDGKLDASGKWGECGICPPNFHNCANIDGMKENNFDCACGSTTCTSTSGRYCTLKGRGHFSSAKKDFCMHGIQKITINGEIYW